MRPRPIDVEAEMEVVHEKKGAPRRTEDGEVAPSSPVAPMHAQGHNILIPKIEDKGVAKDSAPVFRRPDGMIKCDGERVPEVEYEADGIDFDFLDALNGTVTVDADDAAVDESSATKKRGGTPASKKAKAGGKATPPPKAASKGAAKGRVVLAQEQFEGLMTRMEHAIWELQEKTHAHERNTSEGEDHELPFKLSDEPCSVCWQRRKSRKNFIVTCDTCGHSAHQACAVIYTVEKRSKWRCQACVDGVGYGKAHQPVALVPGTEPVLKCDMCPFGREKGLLIRTHDKKGWVHPACAIWLGAVLLGRKTVLKTVKVTPPASVAAAPTGGKGHAGRAGESACFACKKRGNMLKCDYAGCERSFHVQCAQDKGCHLNMDNIYYVNRSVQQQSALRESGGLLADVPGLGMLSPPGTAPKKGSSKSANSTYKKFNVISVNCSQLCNVHAGKRHELQQAQQAQLQKQHPHGTDDNEDADEERKAARLQASAEYDATLDAESIWMRVREQLFGWLPDKCPRDVGARLYDHWVDRRLENGKWGELPLLRSLEARRYEQRREQRLRKREQKRLALPSGGLLHIPTDPVYNAMIELRVEMDKARTIVDLIARRERLKRQMLQAQVDDAGLDRDVDAMLSVMDLGELSTDKDKDDDGGGAAAVVRPPGWRPPTRQDIPPLKGRRRGPPRPGRGELQLLWPDAVAARRSAVVAAGSNKRARAAGDDESPLDDEQEDPEWGRGGAAAVDRAAPAKRGKVKGKAAAAARPAIKR